MSESGFEHLEPFLRCSCGACRTWRRVGGLIGLAHFVSAFTTLVEEELKGVVDRVLDTFDVQRSGSSPVAAGGVPPPIPVWPVPPNQSPRTPTEVEGEKLEKRPKKERSPGKKKKRSRKASRSRGHRREASPAPRSSPKKASGSRPSSKKDKSPEVVGVSKREEKKGFIEVKTEPKEPEDSEAEKGLKETKRATTPEREVRGSEKEKEPEDLEDNSRPPGNWVLRPREPSRSPPAHLRGPRARPSYSSREWDGYRQKNRGRTRDYRNADIAKYGFCPERKERREEEIQPWKKRR